MSKAKLNRNKSTHIRTHNSEYVSTIRAAKMLHYSRQHISYLVRCKVLAGGKFSRDVLVTRASVLAYKQKYPKHRPPGRKKQLATAAVTKEVESID